MMLFEPSPVINGRIRSMFDQMLPHQKPIWKAVLNGCTYVSVIQGDGAFKIPTKRPVVMVVGDDLHASKGPRAFHKRSLEAYLSRCMGAAIVSSEATVEAYAPLALQAIGLRHDVVIVETQPEHEDEWVALLERAAPLASVLLSKPFPRERAH